MIRIFDDGPIQSSPIDGLIIYVGSLLSGIGRLCVLDVGQIRPLVGFVHARGVALDILVFFLPSFYEHSRRYFGKYDI